MRRYRIFRFCMLVGAAALVAVAMYYFSTYAMTLDAALASSSLRADLSASIRALWLAFAFQALLIGLLYALVAFRPPAISREVIVLLGMLQLLEAVLLFMFAGSVWMALVLVAVAGFVLAGAVLWPMVWPPPAVPAGHLRPTEPGPSLADEDSGAVATAPTTAPDLPPTRQVSASEAPGPAGNLSK